MTEKFKDKIEIKDLPEKLKMLSGADFAEAEKAEISVGNKALDVTQTRSYSVRIASMALNCKPADILKLPALEYFAVIRQVNYFLLRGLEMDKTLFNLPETLPSDLENLAE